MLPALILPILLCMPSLEAQAGDDVRVAEARLLLALRGQTLGLGEAGGPITMAVVGDEPLARLLKAEALAVREKASPVLVRYVPRLDPEALRDCRIVFIGRSEEVRLPALLTCLAGRPVLTVGNTPGFAQRGVMVNLLPQGRTMTFEVNTAALEAGRLSMLPAFLARARKVAAPECPEAPAPGTLWRDPDTGLELCWVPPGTFLREGHPVTLRAGYWIGRTEVTQGQFKALMGHDPSHFQAGGPAAPVEQVTWAEAEAFIARLNAMGGHVRYRLPSEAEWEYACRAGTTTPYAFGGRLGPTQANFDGRFPDGVPPGVFRQTTLPVGSFQPNAWGLYDMHGNVWEWCRDWRGPYAEGPATDPLGPRTGTQRVFRGGGWRNDGALCRSGWRMSGLPDVRMDCLGFRVVGTLDATRGGLLKVRERRRRGPVLAWLKEHPDSPWAGEARRWLDALTLASLQKALRRRPPSSPEAVATTDPELFAMLRQLEVPTRADGNLVWDGQKRSLQLRGERLSEPVVDIPEGEDPSLTFDQSTLDRLGLRLNLEVLREAGIAFQVRLETMAAPLIARPVQPAQDSSEKRSSMPMEYDGKARIIRAVGRYVNWPRNDRPSDQPFLIGVLGDSPFERFLEQGSPGTIQNRPIAIAYLPSLQPEHILACDLLFICASEVDRLKDILRICKGRPILTVGDTPGFSRQGVMINLAEEAGRILFEVNLRAAREAGLEVMSALLTLRSTRITQ